MTWLATGHAAAATEQILDAAGRLFREHGPGAVGMDAVARAAGCSRATLYRYFDNRHALLVAYAHREARAVLARVAASVEETAPSERATEAVVSCLREVRSHPELTAWYAQDTRLLSEILRESPLVEAIVAGFVGEPEEPGDRDLARWVLRTIVSFLAVPGEDEAEERRLVARFLSPHVGHR
jgi:AcrR family transcriptional regulator